MSDFRRWSNHLDGNPSTTHFIALISPTLITSEETILPFITVVILDAVVFGFKRHFPHM